ncbi:hypothetical protein GCM10010329_08710 [Streptomyces spiroverticillatus]|uniref:DUF5667 domain-containing protein n=1 Tax=Streptomyces finlayi TaxID=67296 RepID=A0A918WTK6_9ACTN|nr:DUF5667 domain-containing protein [Streptomyces finlayi]GGZ90309.1 hypothetical protein GCM10010329_08710 [Streptomyces spiroverticillatus]GHC81150.1 hypothetical protein GCM10010334_08700 [Streptomyces finlayi]
MIANVSAHRRANAFAQALEDQELQGTAAEQPEGTAGAAEGPGDQGALLSLVSGLGDLPAPEMDPEVKVVQRAQLVAAMEAMLLEGTAGGPAGPQVPEQRTGRGAHRATSLRKLRPRSRWSKGLAAGGLTVGVAAGAFGGVAAASSNALPGDSLYGLKRGMEDLKLTMADDASDRGQIYLDQASTRLQEARRLMERGRAAQLDHEQLGEVRRTLNGMKHDVGEGHRLLYEAYERDGNIGPIQALDAFAQSHRDSWSSLRGLLPAQLGDVGSQVSSVFDAIDQEVNPLRSLLPALPQSDQKPSAPGAHKDRPGTPHRTDGTRPAAPGTTPGRPHQGRPGSPPPASSDGKQSDGLIGGAGDLLDPPSNKPAPSTPGKPAKPAVPDVTIPPILPDVLPGLGIDGEDTNKR